MITFSCYWEIRLGQDTHAVLMEDPGLNLAYVVFFLAKRKIEYVSENRNVCSAGI